MFGQDEASAIKHEQLNKLDDIINRVRKSEHEGSYATVDGVDTVDDIWYLLDMVRHLNETVIHARGLLSDAGAAFAKALNNKGT
jgi:hypothetical protein